LVDTGHSRIPKAATGDPLPYHGSIEDHVRLLNISQQVMQRLIEDARIQKSAAPTLVHPDFHKRNIYVSPEDPTTITGIIDWQSTSIEPAFICINEIPDFASLPEESISEDEDKTETADYQKRLKDASICYQTYDACIKGLMPKLRSAALLDPVLFKPFHYCHTTWRDGAAALRQELIELSARWTELGMPGSCPYSPTNEEINEQTRHYEDFETVQRLKLWLKSSLDTNSDGWVPNEVWDKARDAHRAAYDEWIRTARESDDLTVEKAEKLWPFDSR
jgi:hypothetical protein